MMKKILIIFLCVFSFTVYSYAADTKGSALDATGGVNAANDKLYVIDATGPSSKADTVQTVVNAALVAPGAIGGTTPAAGTFTTIIAGSAVSVTLGTGSSAAGSAVFHNATNNNAFTITSGVSGAAIGWTLPTAAPGGANYLVNADADGTMGYTDPAGFQAADADLTTYAGITPSADIQTFLGYANFAAIKAGLSIDDLVTLSGVADGAVNLGAFTGSTITDNVTVKAALQLLETAVEGVAGGHDAVTLSAAAGSNLLSLSTQEIGLDTQTANYVFAGPVEGAAAAPAFRALVVADIPDLTTSEVAAATLVTAAEGIGSNNNDTTLPTSAAVKAYADSVAGAPTNVTPVDTADENATFYPLLVDGATGSQATETDGEFTYNPSTGLLTVPTLSSGAGGFTVDADGDLVAKTLTTGATAAPGVIFSDSDAPGTDKEVGKILYQYVDGADGSENADFLIQAMQDGSEVTVLGFDESDDQLDVFKDINLGSNDILMTGSIGITGSRVTKGWFADLEVTTLPTVGGATISPTNVTPVDTADENATFYFLLVDGATGTQVVETDAELTYNPSTDLLTSGNLSVTTQFKLPSSDADPTATAGYLRHDSTISNFTNGGLVYYNGAAIKQLVDMTTATASACTDDQVVAYDADNDLWYCKDDANTGSATALDDIADPDGDGTIDQTGYKTTWTSTLNTAGSVWTFTNTTADLTADVSFFDLKYTDDGDANGFFIRGYDNAGGDLKFSIGADGAIVSTGSITGGTSFIIGGADLNETDLEKLDGITNGTQAANKAVVADANINIGVVKATELHIGTSGSETQVTATAAELNYNDIASLGTGAASKAVVLDGSGNYTAPAGTWNLGGATALEIPNSDDPDTSVTGQISFDTDGWMRVYNNSRQEALARTQEEIHVTVVKPQDMADAVRDAFLVWSNESGMTFVITGWKCWAGADDTSLNIETTAADGSSNATVDAVECATGSGPYTGSDTTITAPNIANGSLIWLDFDDTDDPSYVKLVIYGYYNADVN